jgi:hypothetical protein
MLKRTTTSLPWPRPDLDVILLAILAAGFLGYLIWNRSAPIRAGGWRVGAGLGAAAIIVVGAVSAIRGDEWVGLPLVGIGLILALLGRAGRGGFRSAGPAPGEPMSPDEARSILGVGQGASAQEIRTAYMRLMKRNHPDQGGTSGLASKLNAARDRLLGSR